MAMALTRKLRSPLSGSIGGASRVWHAPAPARYRFAIQAAGDQALLKRHALLDAEWTASAWAWAPITTAAAAANPVGRPTDEAMWAAIVGMTKSAETPERNGALQSAQLEQLLKLLKDRSIHKEKGAAGKGWMLYLLGFAVCCVSLDINTRSVAMNAIHEFVVSTFNDAVTDPETQHNVKLSAITFADTVESRLSSRLNPFSWVKEWFGFGGDEEDHLSYADVIAKDVALCLQILLIMLPNPFYGYTVERIVKVVNTVGKQDPARVWDIMVFLENSGYIAKKEVMMAPGKKVTLRTYVPTWVARLDSKNGLLEKKLKALLKAKKKEEGKTNKIPQKDKSRDKEK